MCGIFGLTITKSLKKDDKIQRMVKAFLREEEKHGKSASGLAALSPSKISVIKGNVSASELLNDTRFDEFLKSLNNSSAVIGHCRLPTKGDPEKQENNHPIVSGKVVGIHKGVLSNDEELWKSKGIVDARLGEVDSEIIFHLLSKHFFNNNVEDAISNVAKIISGTATVAFFSTITPSYMYLFHKNGPDISFCKSPIGDFWVFSDSGITSKVVKEITNVSFMERKLPENVGLRIHTGTNKVRIWEI